jgi:5-methylcytosine-specific restriction endonuclease McrA
VRPINQTALNHHLPSGWKEKAQKALEAVRAAAAIGDRDKAKALERYSGVWRDPGLKQALADLSYHKCWYCEGHDLRSDGVVDHFRPKARVFGVASHPGYWWLAFAPSNFRYCCTYCNSRRIDLATGRGGGKQDQFPLFDEKTRAYPEDAGNGEKVILLDPVKAADTILLYFGDDGEVQSRHPKGPTWRAERVKISIDVYHLNHTDLIEARLELLNRIRNSIDLGKTFYSAWQHGDDKAEIAFNSALDSLKQLVTDRAEFSTAARDMIKGMREEDHRWIDDIL